jgi:hypothetical protein
MNKRAIALVTTLLAAASLASTDAEASEQWYVVEIMGSPVGFASEVEEREGDTVLLRTHMDLEMSRMGAPLGMFMAVEEVCDAAGNFLHSRMEMTASITGMSARAELVGDTLHYHFETAGSVDERVIPWDPDAVSQVRANERVKEWLRGDEPETVVTTFRVDEGKFLDLRMVRKETATRTIDGYEQRVIVTEEYEGDSTTPISTTTYDEDLVPYRTVMRQMGLEIVVRRVSPEEMASIEVDPNFDIIRQSMIPVSGYPEPPSRARSVTMRLEFPRPLDTVEPLDGPNQKELVREDGHIDLLVSRDHLGEEADIDAEVFLEPDRYIQSEHPTIRAIADSIAAATPGDDDWSLAGEISRWVSDHITEKNYAQGFASALEACETRTGDCTEHSMLLTALLRAAGIPARPVVGLAYSEGQFVGHMWVEAWVDGWRSLDALDLDLDPIRIRVSASEGETVDHRALMKAYAVVGGMTVDVIDHEALR